MYLLILYFRERNTDFRWSEFDHLYSTHELDD
jgi:hypothetical protein